MNTEVKVPSVGEAISTGQLSVWHKHDGDTVEIGDILFSLETDKVATEVLATAKGFLQILMQEGAEVFSGQVVATISSSRINALAEDGLVREPDVLEIASAPARKNTPPIFQVPASQPPAPRLVVEPFEPPLKITTTSDLRSTRKKLSPLRRKIASQLVAAQRHAAILTTFNECDMSAVMGLRAQLQDEFQKRHGVKLGFMSIFIKAAVDALQAVPSVNSRMDGDDLVINHYYDISIAVGTDRGLMSPVVRDCETKSFAQIEQDIVNFSIKAREGKLNMEDIRGGVFGISNGGIYGSLMSTPILNPPQSGILGMHKIQDRPVAVDGKVEIRPMMYLALSYDHRVVDGQEAVTFLQRIKQCIENPARMFVGV